MSWKTTTITGCCLALSVLTISPSVSAAELLVGKTCPVYYQQQPVGFLVFSREWYHTSRSHPSYTATDNSTGVGLEIHFFSNDRGDVDILNLPDCDRYRMLQIRTSNARMLPGEKTIQVDVPDSSTSPFYDSSPLEHGRGVHLAPPDDTDKPWTGRPTRASTVAIYDTPYVSDAWGVWGDNIDVSFETCVVCERDQQYDELLSCGNWGYRRTFMGGMTGWAEPEFQPVQCQATASELYRQTLNASNRIEYSYWINWR